MSMNPPAECVYRGYCGNSRHVLCLVIMTAWMVFFSACGKKAPPVRPTYKALPVVTGLQVIVENNVAELQWPVPKWEGKDEHALNGFYVYQSQIAFAGEDCPDCPLRFKKTATVRMEKDNAGGSYSVILEKGFRYAFKVSAFTADGSEGEPSDMVTAEWE